MNTQIETDVLIVGAGPTGLSLAVQLARYGINFIIIDPKEGVTDLSKALVVHARTLEIYDQLGLAQTALDGGRIARQVTLLHDGHTKARLDLSDFGGRLTPFPYLLVFEQSKNERLLASHLQQQGKAVAWQTELTNLTQDANGVRAVLRTPNGDTQTIEARYVVGCDGAGSPTRHLLNLDFEGSTFPRLFYVADVEMAFAAAADSLYATFGQNAFVLLFPMEGENHWRLVGNLPEYNDQPDRAVPYEEIEAKVKALVQQPLEISRVRWFSTYKVHTRHAETFARGRCFLAGDAAHIHTPAGGQGMNTGIQDAYNLAWKLAVVLNGWAGPALLDTYNEERLANAKHLLKTTDRFFDVAVGNQWYLQIFRDTLMPGLVNLMSHIGVAKEYVFPTVSQIGITYRDQSLSWHGDDEHFKVKAGDRLPYFTVDGANGYHQFNAPKFHLLQFSAGRVNNRDSLATLPADYTDVVQVVELPLLPQVQDLFGHDKPFWVLLRPDHHIGYLDTSCSLDVLDAYMTQRIGYAPTHQRALTR